jgi:hypothetical protein
MRASVNAERAELPLTGVIYAPIERQYQGLSRGIRPGDWTALLAFARASVHACASRRALASRRSPALLRDAARRMTDVDLDTAWRAALRGDDATMLARVTPHVDPRPRKRKQTGSPWRMSGWLSRRATMPQDE